MTAYPTAVVVNTTMGSTTDAGPDGVPFTPDTALAYAAELNAACNPGYRDWAAFALVPLPGLPEWARGGPDAEPEPEWTRAGVIRAGVPSDMLAAYDDQRAAIRDRSTR